MEDVLQLKLSGQREEPEVKIDCQPTTPTDLQEIHF